jgi:hypothetical protein
MFPFVFLRRKLSARNVPNHLVKIIDAKLTSGVEFKARGKQMTKIVTTAEGKKTEFEIETSPGGFCCLVHDQGVRVDVPEFVEINPRNTIACMEKMKQKEWEWITQGELFRELFNMSFNGSHRGGMPSIPETIEELNGGDFGVIHICGLIVLGCEAFFEGRSIFVRNPETYLHPATEQMIVGMFKRMLELCGKRGVITEVAPGEEPPTSDPKIFDQPLGLVKPEISDVDKEQTLRWLHCMDSEKVFAKIGSEVYRVADMILEIIRDTATGQKMIEKFVELRDKRSSE